MDQRATIVESIPTLSSRVEITIGKLLQDAGKISETDIKRVLNEQKNGDRRFGEIAVRLGLVNAEDVLRALSQQFEYPLSPARSEAFSPHLVAARQPFGESAEALRALRSQLMLRWFTGRRRLLALAGTRAGDGCSRLAANLAVAFAQLGHRTLLIDADLRDPALHTFFGMANSAGLSGILSGRATLGDGVARIDALRNLSLLRAGPMPPNPQELLSRATFLHLLGHAAREYDTVIIDTTPASACVDAQIVAAAAGGCLLVTRRHHSRVDDIARLREQLAPAGATVVGAVIND